jgi:hypothetical protein
VIASRKIFFHQNGVLTGAALSRSGFAPVAPANPATLEPPPRPATPTRRAPHRQASRQETCHAACWTLSLWSRRASHTLLVRSPAEVGASESKVFLAGECRTITGNHGY